MVAEPPSHPFIAGKTHRISGDFYRVFAAFIFTCVFAITAPAQSKQTEPQPRNTEQAESRPDEDESTRTRAREALEALYPMLESREALRERITAITADLETTDVTDKPAFEQELERLNEEFADLNDQISVLTTGISERQYSSSKNIDFDLQTELERLIEPFMSLMISATDEARQIERMRRDIGIARDRLGNAEMALRNLDAALMKDLDEALVADLSARREVWLERKQRSISRITGLERQLTDLLAVRANAGTEWRSAIQSFFRERGLSLVLGLSAFAFTFLLCRLISLAAKAYMQKPGRKKTFITRLMALLFSGFTILASFAAMLVVFNMRHDWLLLGLSILVLLALIWVGIKMLPDLIEQVTVLLNLGAVQENERVLYNGVPFRVRNLSFYTDLVNPTLDGGEFTLPVRELIGMHSRPVASDETWFPSRKGDWVKLNDGRSGQVIAQTPEMVVVEFLGGSRVTYQTPDYLAQTPENLSHGFRVEIEFGIGYRHQKHATDEVIRQMKSSVDQRMRPFIGDGYVRSVDVEFLRAGASSLDYEVEVDVTGAAAPRYEQIERELARVLVDIATEQGWEIPFQQLVVHRTADAG